MYEAVYEECVDSEDGGKISYIKVAQLSLSPQQVPRSRRHLPFFSQLFNVGRKVVTRRCSGKPCMQYSKCVILPFLTTCAHCCCRLHPEPG